MPSSTDDLARRVSLILERVDQLPTLSSVALRLLEVTSSETSDGEDVIELVSSDPSLSARLLQLCRRANRGVSLEGADVAAAVRLLGFDEVRAAAAAVQVFELLKGRTSAGGELHREGGQFTPAAFWQHSIAVAVLAERIVQHSNHGANVRGSDAFLGGLMHDLGHLALHTILPATFDRACEIADTHGCTIDEACRTIIGLDTHTVGKHLAEHWRLPQRLIETIWLNGEPVEAIGASASHSELIHIVSLADMTARRLLLAHAGHGSAAGPAMQYAAALKIDRSIMERACNGIHDAVAARLTALGMGEPTNVDLLRQSIARAGVLVARLQAGRMQQRAMAGSQSHALRAAAELLDNGLPAASTAAAISGIARSAHAVLGRIVAVVSRFGDDGHAILSLVDVSGAVVETRTVVCSSWSSSSTDNGTAIAPAGKALPWLDSALFPRDIANPLAISLECGDEISAAILCAGPLDPSVLDEASLGFLRRLWGAAMTAAGTAARTAELSERLVTANRRLVDMQEVLASQRAAQTVAEFANGAAHEMNNPLTVISAQAQSLSRNLHDGPMRRSAEEIVRQAHRISDLITSLKISTEAPAPEPALVNVCDVIADAVRQLRQCTGEGGMVRVNIQDALPPIRLDRAQVSSALRELLQNAQEAQPRGEIAVRAQTDPLDGRLIISVIDAGPGLSERAREHAFDPFFSEKPAGRQPGLGLPRARRLVEGNAGTLTLRNGPSGGTIATIALDHPRRNRPAVQTTDPAVNQHELSSTADDHEPATRTTSRGNTANSTR